MVFALFEGLARLPQTHFVRQSNAPMNSGEMAHDPSYGMHPALFALVFGILSGTSLPIGAWLGVALAPVKKETCALMMAFGAGALLFAVTVELYGHALAQVADGDLGLMEIFTTIFGAFVGCAFYLTINQWLDDWMMKDLDDVESGKEIADDKKTAAVQDAASPQETDSLMKELKKQRDAAETEKATVEAPSSGRGKDLWKKAIPKALADKSSVVKAARIIRSDSIMRKGESRLRGREIAFRALHEQDNDDKHAKSVAFALFLGLLVDGVPEGVLMGFLAAEGHLTPVLVISLFVANFPEAFSSASLLVQAKMSVPKIIGMWTGLCLLVGSLGGLSCYLLLLVFPEFGQGGLHSKALPMPVLLGISLVEGITGGAMIACISAVMLPEAFEQAGKHGPFYTQSGFWCTSGFLLSVALKALFG